MSWRNQEKYPPKKCYAFFFGEQGQDGCPWNHFAVAPEECKIGARHLVAQDAPAHMYTPKDAPHFLGVGEDNDYFWEHVPMGCSVATGDAWPATTGTCAPLTRRLDLATASTATRQDPAPLFEGATSGPSAAIDGYLATCVHTATHTGAGSPWWEVDLASATTIAAVEVVGSSSAPAGHLDRFEVDVRARGLGDDVVNLCATGVRVEQGGTRKVACYPGARGTTIRLTAGEAGLALCELRAFAYDCTDDHANDATLPPCDYSDTGSRTLAQEVDHFQAVCAGNDDCGGAYHTLQERPAKHRRARARVVD